MPDPKGSLLYVNLSASQTRRRLKGFGHGVRKVQSAGKNRAVVIHTAVGRHLEELEDKFADVGCSSHEEELNLEQTGKRWNKAESQIPMKPSGCRKKKLSNRFCKRFFATTNQRNDA